MRICVHTKVQKKPNYNVIVLSLLTKLFKSMHQRVVNSIALLQLGEKNESDMQLSLAGKLINLFRWLRVPDVIWWI